MPICTRRSVDSSMYMTEKLSWPSVTSAVIGAGKDVGGGTGATAVTFARTSRAASSGEATRWGGGFGATVGRLAEGPGAHDASSSDSPPTRYTEGGQRSLP